MVLIYELERKQNHFSSVYPWFHVLCPLELAVKEATRPDGKFIDAESPKPVPPASCLAFGVPKRLVYRRKSSPPFMISA